MTKKAIAVRGPVDGQLIEVMGNKTHMTIVQPSEVPFRDGQIMSATTFTYQLMTFPTDRYGSEESFYFPAGWTVPSAWNAVLSN